MNTTIAGTGYVGLPSAILLAQHNTVIALDIVQAKVDLINARRSPIEDAEIDTTWPTSHSSITLKVFSE